MEVTPYWQMLKSATFGAEENIYRLLLGEGSNIKSKQE